MTAHAIDITPISPMSFLASPRFLMVWRRISCYRINACYAANFVLIAGYVPHVGLGPVRSARLYATVVAGPCPTPCQTSYGQCWRTPPPLAAIRAGFVYNAFSRALILRFKHADGLYLTPVLGWFLARHFAALHQPGNLVVCIAIAIWHDAIINLPSWRAGWHRQMNFAPAILLRQHHNKSQAGLNRAQRQRMLAYSLWHPKAGQTYLADQ